MLSIMLLAAAAAASAAPTAVTEKTIALHEIQQGPMPAENVWLRQGHADDRMFPDIVIGELTIDGDTLYIHVQNKSHSATPGPVLVAARAEENGSRTAVVEQRIARLLPGETRWVPLRGFSVKTAVAGPAVFALESASAVSAVARLMPSSSGVLDRSGQMRDVDTTDADETNNSVTLSGAAIKHGRPL